MSPKNEGETKKQSGSKLREAPVIPVAAGETDSTPASPSGKSVDLDHLGELPQSYGSDTIFLIAQEPHWLFTYWDIDISRHPGGKTFLRVYEGEKTVEAKIEVPFETRNWYIPVKRAGAKYTVEIGYNRGSVWKVIARSHTIETPPDHLSDSDQFDYATIPLHLSFQKLVESIQQGIQTGETLITALSRLQKEGKPFAFGSDALPGISLEQRIVLEALLGSNFIEELASGGLSSQEVEAKVRKYLEEKLSSQGPISSFRENNGARRKAVCLAPSVRFPANKSPVGARPNSPVGLRRSCRVGRQPARVQDGAANPSAAGHGRRNPAGAWRAGSRQAKAAGHRRPFQAGSRELKAVGHKQRSQAGFREPKAAGRKQHFQAGVKLP